MGKAQQGCRDFRSAVYLTADRNPLHPTSKINLYFQPLKKLNNEKDNFRIDS
jgi:hypothetical protein